MHQLRTRIPFEFVLPRIGSGWADLRYGLENCWLDPMAPVEAARRALARPDSWDDRVAELARADSVDRVVQLLDDITGCEVAVAADILRRKWLFLVLAWLYEHRAQEPDPFAPVELVYADFGHPSEIESFVRYMPMQGADLGSKARNEERMLRRWKDYIDGEARVFAPR